MLWMLASAWAGTLDMTEQMTAGAPSMVLTCSSGTRAIERMADLKAAMDAESGESMVDDSKQKTIDDLLNSGVFTSDTPVSIALWSKGDLGRLKFTSNLPVEEIASMLGEKNGKKEGDHWTFTDRSGDTVHLKQNGTTIEIIDPRIQLSEPTGLGALKKIASDADKVDGCTMVMDTSQDKATPDASAPKLPFDGRILIHIPFEKGSGIFFAVEAPEVKEVLDIAAPDQLPTDIRTSVPPEVLLVLGISLSDINVSEFLEGEKLRKFKKFRRALPIGDGTMIGLMEVHPKPVGGIIIPMSRKIGANTLARRVRKMLDKAGLPYQQSDKTHLSIQAGPIALNLTFQKGRILAASDLSLMAALEAGQGTPWVSGRAAELAAEYPLVMVSTVIPNSDGEPPQKLPAPFSMAIGATDGIIHGYIVLPLSFAEMKRLKEQMDAIRSKRNAPPGIEG